MTARINQGAALPTACSAMPPAWKADEPRSLSTIAAARQKEMNESMTVVATTTLMRPGVFVTSRFIKLRHESTAKLAPQCYSPDREIPPFLTFPLLRSRSGRERRPEIMKIGERCTVGCPTCGGSVIKPLNDN